MREISISNGTRFMVEAMEGAGFPGDHASQIAGVIIDSELRGHADHGLFFFQAVLRWPAGLGMEVNPEVKIARETEVTVNVDGGNGCGVIGMNLATDRAIEKAASSGMAAGVVANTQNVVALAPFVQRAADAGMIAIACSGFRYPVMPPFGGLEGAFGTNPFAFASPAGENYPFLLDMSTSGMAGAKILEARDRGDVLPEGFLEDLEGNPVTDPALFKMGESLVLPMAGVKGYGLAMMVDVLTGVLGGDDWGHFIWVMDVSRFSDPGEYGKRMDEEIARIKAVKRKPGVDEIFYAGERGQARMARLRSEGRMPLTDETWKVVEQIAESTGVALPE